MIHFLALLGVLSISFSAVFIRLASVSPVTATFFRAAYATPILLVLWLMQRSGDRRSARERWLAVVSGVILAADLNLWHESIALVGAGLGTVIPNVQVVFVAAAAWLLYGERPRRATALTIALVLAGVACTSGLARGDAYGSNPVRGAALGLLAGVAYAAFLLVYREANRSAAPRSGPLFDSTIGVLAGAIASAALDRHLTLTPSASAHFWLFLLALVSQVVGWLLIGSALSRLSAIETSVMLLGQPVFALIWGMLLFGERLSMLQWIGTGMVLAGVGTMMVSQSPAQRTSV
jgi:drug/metabolite transporter (DMT)-like permease